MKGFSKDSLMNNCEEQRPIVDAKFEQAKKETGSVLEAHALLVEWLREIYDVPPKSTSQKTDNI